MPKTISAGLEAHLALTTTTLATIWRIVREKDGVKFFFTDHDVDIVFNGDTYKASSGYNRSALQNDSSLAVDNLSLESLFNSQDITEADMRAGLFDFATVTMSLVNWDDLSQGEMLMRVGRLGEVNYNRQGLYRAELRGMSEFFSQRIGSLVSAECRYDLGDDKCLIPIVPDLVLRDTAYILGDFVRVKTAGATDPIPLTLGTNKGLDSVTGWTINAGTPDIGTTNPLPHEGTGFLQDSASVDYDIEQIIAIDTDLTAAKIDTGDYTMDYSSWYAQDQFDGDDTGTITVDFLTAADAFITTATASGVLDPSVNNTWFEWAANAIPIPATARKIRITLTGHEVGFGTRVRFIHDDITVKFHDVVTLAAEGWEIYENRAYECTIAGTTASTTPTYDTIVGNTTVDGTATFTAREAFTRHADVNVVTDQLNLTIDGLTESRAVDGWFDGGLITFHGASANTGLSMEIRSWVQTGGVIEIFLPLPFVMSSNDKISIYPGCNKLRSICDTKFDNVINFGGEPDVPGSDELNNNPDAG